MDRIGEGAGERAMIAERAWSAAKQAGDEPARVAALREYREAMREVRAVRRGGQTLAEAMAAEDHEPYRQDRGAVRVQVALVLAAVAAVGLVVVSALMPCRSAVVVPVGLDDRGGCAVWVQPGDGAQGYFVTLNGEAGSLVCAGLPR